MNLKDIRLNSDPENQAMVKAALIERIVVGEVLSFSKADDVEYDRPESPFGDLKPRLTGVIELTVRVRFPKPRLEEASDDDILSEMARRLK